MDKQTTFYVKAWGVLMLALLTLVPCAALARGEVRSEADVLMCLAFLAPNLVLLYWPIKWHRAHLRRTAPEREQAREAARQQAAERAEARLQQRLRMEQQRREKADQVACARNRRSALAQVETFYRKHADLLQESCPPELFRTLVRSNIPDDLPAEKAWAGVRDVIAALQPLVASAKERRAQDEKRKRERAREVRDINHQIEEHRQEIARMRRSPVPADVNQPEIANQEDIIRDLKRRQAELQEEG